MSSASSSAEQIISRYKSTKRTDRENDIRLRQRRIGQMSSSDKYAYAMLKLERDIARWKGDLNRHIGCFESVIEQCRDDVKMYAYEQMRYKCPYYIATSVSLERTIRNIHQTLSHDLHDNLLNGFVGTAISEDEATDRRGFAITLVDSVNKIWLDTLLQAFMLYPNADPHPYVVGELVDPRPLDGDLE